MTFDSYSACELNCAHGQQQNKKMIPRQWNSLQLNKRHPKIQISVTRHSTTINKKKINYTVTTGTIVLKEELDKEGEEAGKSDGEKPKASIFFVAYTKDGTRNLSKRPITFSFNGGPGSSSVWLHMGVLGPRRVKLDKDGHAPPPPYERVDNAYSMLDKTDLVFIRSYQHGL